MPPTASVFICHASQDAATANRIAVQLEQVGIACWLAPRSIRGGETYADAIVQGIRDSASMVVLLTEKANASVFVHREVERAASQSKQLIAFRLEPVMPAKGLELFLSSTQWIEAHQLGIKEAIEALQGALFNRTPAPKSESLRSEAKRKRRLQLSVIAMLCVLVAILVALRVWRAPVGHDSALLSKEPQVTAAAVRAAARVGKVDDILPLFSQDARSRQTPSRWQAIAAATRADLETSTADAEVILHASVPSSSVGLGEGSFFVVQSQRPKDGGYLCEQVLLREEATRWAAESFTYWPSAEGACVGKTELVSATQRAHSILNGLKTTGEISDGDLADILKRLATSPSWKEYSRNLSELIESWQPEPNLLAAAPLPGLPQGNGMPLMPGRIAQIRYALDRAGTRANLDLYMQQEGNGEWHLAAITLQPGPY